MLAPPSEPPEQILVPSAVPDANPVPLAITDDEPVTITADDATDIVVDDSVEILPENEDTAAPPNTSRFFHRCRADETLDSVAELYAVAPDQLAALNGITSASRPKPGKQLLLPRDFSNVTSAPDISTYTVVAGDTYSSIARQYNLSFEALMKLNGAADAALQIGDVLYVPKSAQ